MDLEEVAFALARRYADVIHVLPAGWLDHDDGRDESTTSLLVAARLETVSFDVQMIVHPYIELIHRWARVHNMSLEFCRLKGNAIQGYRHVSKLIHMAPRLACPSYAPRVI